MGLGEPCLFKAPQEQKTNLPIWKADINKGILNQNPLGLQIRFDFSSRKQFQFQCIEMYWNPVFRTLGEKNFHNTKFKAK